VVYISFARCLIKNPENNMTTEYQAAMAKLATDTKTACATSADIVKAAKAKAAAQAAHAAKAAKAAKAAEAQAATVAKAHAASAAKTANVTKAAYATSRPAAKGFSFYAKAAFLTHPYLFSVAGGVFIGIAAYHISNKYWLNNKEGVVAA